jgi:hypothetical protein
VGFVPGIRQRLAAALTIDETTLATLAGAVVLVAFLVTPPTANRLMIAHVSWKYAAANKGRPLLPQIRQMLVTTEPASRIAPIAYIYGFTFLLGCGGIWLYATRLYPLIPQALGGSKPRCAALDLLGNHLSDETLTELSLHERPDTAVRTAPLQVILVTTDSIVVVTNRGGSRFIEELRRDSVTAVRWCDND